MAWPRQGGWGVGPATPPVGLAGPVVAVLAGITVAVVVLTAAGAVGGRAATATGSAVAALATELVQPAPVLPRLGPPRAVTLDDVGDPFVLTVPPRTSGDSSEVTRYVLFWTTDWVSNVPAAVSTDLVHWRRVPDALPVLPSWALPSRTMTWAPSAAAVPGGWVLYFSTAELGTGRECIGVAFAAVAEGPFRSTAPAPLICQRSLGGSIDPSPVVSAGGRFGLVWKSDGNAIGRPAALWQSALSADGQRTAGPVHRLLGADLPWQQGIVEGPSMRAAARGGWWLTYSGGAWQSARYATGVAWCRTVTGPCRDASRQPLLRSTPARISPGGLETFRDASGELWAAYSTFPSAPQDPRAAMGENRVLQLRRVLSW